MFNEIKPSLQEPPIDTSCNMIYDFAAMAPVLFVVLHENAHQRLHHSTKKGLHLHQELEADASALAAMKIIRDKGIVDPSIPTNIKEQLRWIFNVAPALWLKVDSLRLGSGGASAEATARLKAVLEADVSVSAIVREYITPENSSNSLNTLHIHIDHPVQRYVIDGRMLFPTALPRDGLIVTRESHTVVALCSDGVAVSRQSGEPQFFFASYASVAEDILHKEADAGKWEQVLAETSSVDLEPRAEALLSLHSQALMTLGLASMISPHALAELNEHDREIVRESQEKLVPLSSWHYDQDRKTVQ